MTEGSLDAIADENLVQTAIDAILEYIGDLQLDEADYQLVRQIPNAAQFFWAMRLFE